MGEIEKSVFAVSYNVREDLLLALPRHSTNFFRFSLHNNPKEEGIFFFLFLLLLKLLC